MKPLSRLVSLGILGVMVLSFAGCNTTRGFGRDVEKGGEALQRSAERHGAD